MTETNGVVLAVAALVMILFTGSLLMIAVAVFVPEWLMNGYKRLRGTDESNQDRVLQDN